MVLQLLLIMKAENVRETGKMGDIWTKEQVKDVYQNVSLEEALADRQRSYDKMKDMLD